MLKSASKNTNYFWMNNIVKNSKKSKDDGNEHSKITKKVMLIRTIAIEQVAEYNHAIIVEDN